MATYSDGCFISLVEIVVELVTMEFRAHEYQSTQLPGKLTELSVD